MNNITELVERLKGPFNYAPRNAGEPHFLKVPEKLIEQAITYLSQSLPEDEASIIKGLRIDPTLQSAADMLERLARESQRITASFESMNLLTDDLAKAQQRIAELEEENADEPIDSAALPYEIKKQIKWCREEAIGFRSMEQTPNNIALARNFDKTADTLERLARQKESYKQATIDCGERADQLQQRIAELEEEIGGWEALSNQQDEDLKRLDAALAEIIEHYESAQIGDCAMDVCAGMLYEIARKAVAGE